MKNCIKNNNGFTLIEVMAVILLITITAFFLPSLKKSSSKYELEKTISTIKADLKWARAKAIIDSEKYIFRIYSRYDKNRIPYYFYIEKDGKKIIKRKGYYSKKLLLYKTLSHRLVKDEYYEWIRFMGSGDARGGTIGLSYPGGKVYSLTINQLGRVRVEKQ